MPSCFTSPKGAFRMSFSDRYVRGIRGAARQQALRLFFHATATTSTTETSPASPAANSCARCRASTLGFGWY
jgi:hypothetical protein